MSNLPVKRKQRRNPQKGVPRKLNDAFIKAFVGHLKSGVKAETSAKICGVSLATVDRWMGQGSQAPYGTLLNRFWSEVNVAIGQIDKRLERTMLSAALRKRKKRKTVTKKIIDAQTNQITGFEETTTEEEILPDANMAMRIMAQRRPGDYNQAPIEATIEDDDAIPIELIFGMSPKQEEESEVTDIDPEDVVEV